MMMYVMPARDAIVHELKQIQTSMSNPTLSEKQRLVLAGIELAEMIARFEGKLYYNQEIPSIPEQNYKG